MSTMEVTLQLHFYTRSVAHLVRVTSSALETPSLCHLSQMEAEQTTASGSHIRQLVLFQVSCNDFYVIQMIYSSDI